MPFAGFYLMSPWATLTATTPSMRTNNGRGIVGTRAAQYWAAYILKGLPDVASALPYIDAVSAPEGWFNNIASVTERVFVSAGEREIWLDVIVRVGQVIADVHRDAKLVVQEGGVHDDPLWDFGWPVWEKKKDGSRKVKVGTLTPVIVDWLVDGWSAE
jgi:acetyl esterase/lipase